MDNLIKQTVNNNVAYIYMAILEPVKALGLEIEIIQDKEDLEDEIVITSKKYPHLKATISGREYQDTTKGKLWLSREVTRHLPARPYFDGSANTQTHRYEFCRYVSDSRLNEIGLEKVNYSYSLSSLQKTFKATKSAKLLCNDIMPSLEKYLLVVKEAMPGIEKTIAIEDQAFELQKAVSEVSDYKYELYGLEDRSFNTPIGRIRISTYGSIELEKNLEMAELKSLLGIA